MKGDLLIRDNFALRDLQLQNLTNTTGALLINANNALTVT